MEDRICEHEECELKDCKILKGLLIYYIDSSQPDWQGKIVCTNCLAHYQRKATMMRRPTEPSYESRLVEQMQDIRKSINTTQSKGTIHPPPVVPITHQSTYSMPPPPLPAPLSCPSRPPEPDVHVPIAWPSLAQPQHATYSSDVTHSISALPVAAFRYGQQHLQYQGQRQHWASMAQHPTPPSETYSLDISAVYECSARLKDIDACSTAHNLANISLATLVPYIKDYYPEFLWCKAKFIVRDKEWAQKPYFYDECLRDSNRKNSKARVFKTGKQFFLYVVIPEKQWQEMEDFQLKVTGLANGRTVPRTHAVSSTR
ncbi:hypothetical protein J3R83DRAFT_11614 [Lanmaoa asiatica]|nr:hypothetical protein J3R83DRAFT_11614 [Lanmaoa asiatica]